MFFKIENDKVVDAKYPGEPLDDGHWVQKNFDDSIPVKYEDGDVVQDRSELPPEPTEEELSEVFMEFLREARDLKLSECDWTQFPDVPEATRLAWQPYRQALRDITEHYSSLEEVVWPTKPEV